MIVPLFVLQACQMLPVSNLPVINLAPPVTEWKEDIQRAIFLVQPVMGSILIRLWAFLFGDGLVGQNTMTSGRPAVGLVSLPVVVSCRPGSRTPLVDTLVRRSSRLNPDVVDGAQVVKIREPASKRRKRGDVCLQP